MMTAPHMLGQYSKWIQAWTSAAGQPPLTSDSLTRIQQQTTAIVDDRVQMFQAGQSDHLELPSGAPAEEMLIAAELEPLLHLIARMELTDRELTAGEHQLLQATSWGDRPSTAFLRDLGQDLTELTETGMLPEDDLGFTAMAYLPGELQVIAQAANLTLDQLYDL